MKKYCASMMLATLASSAAWASDDEFVVTVTKTQVKKEEALGTTAVVTAEDIEQLQPRDVPELLGRISGLSFRDSGGRGSANGVFIRGTAPSQQIVLVDGVRVGSATLGSAALEFIPVESIERIEVVKGPVSGLYGADAIGGVIQIFTKKGKGQSASTRVTLGTNRVREVSQTISDAGERYQLFAGINYEETAGIDRTSIVTNGNEDRDGFEETSGNIGLGFDLTDNTHLQLGYLWSVNNTEFDNTFGSDNGRNTDNDLDMGSAKLVHKLDTVTISASLGYNDERTVTPAFSSDIRTQRYTSDVQVDWDVSDDVTLTGGVDYYDDRVETLANFPVTDRYNIGTFVSSQVDLGVVDVLANLRYDDNEAYGDETNGTLALGFQLAESLKLVVSYGTAFAAPSFNQLYFPGFGNPDLRPEDSESVEISLRGHTAQFDWSVSAYRTDVQNLIGFESLPSGGSRAINIDEAEIEGVEVEFSTQVGDLSIIANADYSEARDEQSNDFLTDRALFSGGLQLLYTADKLSLGVDYTAEHGRRDSGRVLGGFALVGLNANYQFTPKFKASARVDNALDKNYIVNVIGSTNHFNTLGRTFRGTLEYSF